MPDLDLKPEADDQKLLAQVVEFYHGTLKETTVGLEYLRSRGVTADEAIDRFRIGYANRTLGLKLPSMRLKAGKEIRTRLQQLGILRDSGHEHFNGCIVLPITASDGSGQIVDIYGRKTCTHLLSGTPLNMHLGGQRRGVWNIEAFGESDTIILCPSLFDALAFWNAGYRYATCTFGAETPADDYLTACAEFGIHRVLVMVESIASALLAAGLDCYLLRFPSGMDASQYALQVADPSEALGTVIRKAEWLGKKDAPTTALAVPVPPPAATSSEPDVRQTGIENDRCGLDTQPAKVTDGENPPDDELDDDEELLGDVQESDVPAGNDPQSVNAQEAVVAAQPVPLLSDSPPPPATEDVETDVNGDEVTIHCGHRRYRIRGLSKNFAFNQLRVNVLASTESGIFVDTFDLYVARCRHQFIVQAAIELGVEEQTVKKDLGRVLMKLEELQDEMIARVTEPHEPSPVMTPEEKDAALRLLQDPNLLDRIVSDFDVVGETTNKLVGYLAAISRKLDQPLAVIIQSSSAAGKTSLMDAILSFVPPEDQVKYSAMTGQSLFYMGETDLKHKILAIVEEEGAERASYAVKLLQSEAALTIASTAKDSRTGRLVTQEYRVEGPVMIFLTTTATKIDEELLNRCLILSVDEDREQTRAIHQFQRRRQTLGGLLAEQNRHETRTLHHNAQRLLRPLLVANPYAESLTFLDDKTRTRRDHLKYLTLIRAIALVHQYQRPVKTVVHQEREVEYIEVSLEDIATANRLASEVLGRSVDELPPQTRRLLGQVDEMVTTACQRLGIDRADYRFSRRDIRGFTGWGHTQLKVHLKRLEELEYLLVHRGGRGQSFVYELLYDPPPETGTKFLARLIDVEQLRRKYDVDWSGSRRRKSGGGRGHVGLTSAQSRSPEIDASADRPVVTLASDPKVDQNAHLDTEKLATL